MAGWLDGNFASDVYRFFHVNLTPNSKMFFVCWMSFGRIAQITYVGTRRLLMIVGLCEMKLKIYSNCMTFSTTTLRQVNT